MNEGHTIAREVRRWLQDRYGDAIKAVILYGSYARGTPTPDSDVDLVVVVDDALDPGAVRQALGDPLLDVLLDKGLLVSVMVLKDSFYRTYQSPFLVNVRREGVPV